MKKPATLLTTTLRQAQYRLENIRENWRTK